MTSPEEAGYPALPKPGTRVGSKVMVPSCQEKTPSARLWEVLHMIINGYEIKPRAKLAGANLTGANLIGANLAGANLTRANLIGANLAGACLTWANLYEANLTGANLTGACLTWATLAGGCLYGADLAGAKLYGAILNSNGPLPDSHPVHACIKAGACIEGILWVAQLRPDADLHQALKMFGREDWLKWYEENVCTKSI